MLQHSTAFDSGHGSELTTLNLPSVSPNTVHDTQLPRRHQFHHLRPSLPLASHLMPPPPSLLQCCCCPLYAYHTPLLYHATATTAFTSNTTSTHLWPPMIRCDFEMLRLLWLQFASFQIPTSCPCHHHLCLYPPATLPQPFFSIVAATPSASPQSSRTKAVV